ncbi:phospholipase/carboxylesterase [Palleronia marisminoris]|uniref:Putative hydrolase n=1 Tax=Palleronia marisminoris TaxID=315423 RepID=A0A1Y5TQH7_9RHOB|nr:dienelactone hydrolase family protein [Palleronia marisminoris]SFH48666.1 phospholipase/carboxylesterase [Palleronia marisminoris]SLN69498.1 putative hydrolase [Palleronia marisminoris]
MTGDPHGTARIHRHGEARAERALVLLHGRGAGAGDILDLGAALVPAGAAFFAPEAAGRSWWPTSFLAPMAALEPWLGSALAAVERAVAAAREEGYAEDRICLLGFSQGACLALEYVARSGRRLGAVGALSGGLVGTGDAEGGPSKALYGHSPKRFDYMADLARMPIYLGCHARDPHIPLARVRESEAVLSGLGTTCEVVIHPGAGHAVTAEDATAMRRLLVSEQSTQ